MLRLITLMALAAGTLPAHDVFSTNLTWTRDISRIIVQRCLGCHQDGGKAFSLAKFEEARPWAKAIKEEVINRRMPPWGAVKGFGEFKDDPSLTQEEIGLISNWVEGGSPEGDKVFLPDMKAPAYAPVVAAKGRPQVLTGEFLLKRAGSIVALSPTQLGAPAQVVAELPDGSVEPLLWILDPAQARGREYQYDQAIALPKGTRIVAPQGSWRVVFR